MAKVVGCMIIYVSVRIAIGLQDYISMTAIVRGTVCKSNAVLVLPIRVLI